MKKAEVTVYLSLVFLLFLALIGALIESASIQTLKSYKRADMNRAMECIFAEYQKELLEQYEVFALDATYEAGTYAEEQIFDRLRYYLPGTAEQEIVRIQFLSDNGGEAFREQVSNYMEHKYGLELLHDKIGITEIWQQQKEESETVEETEQSYQETLDSLLEEQEGELAEEGNPMPYMKELKKMPLLELVMPTDQSVSEKVLPEEQLLTKRELQKGFGDFSDMKKETSVADNLLFGQYLLDHFSNASGEAEGNVLEYEIEYLIGGKMSDRENLTEVAKKLLLMRFVPNYAYLQSSPEKKAEAQALALTLSSVLAVPAVTEAVAQVLLLLWAYGEAIMDLRTLLGGGKVPLTKNDASWQLALSGLMKLRENGSVQDGKDTENGLRYEEYLRMLLFLNSKENTAMRALDLIEQNLQNVGGLTFFYADRCISKLEVKSKCQFQRNITYQFSTYYGYN